MSRATKKLPCDHARATKGTLSTLDVPDGGFSDNTRLAVSTKEGLELVDTSTSPPKHTVLYESSAVLDVDVSPDDK